MPKVQRSHGGRDRPGPSACPSTHRGRLGACASPTLIAGPRPRHTQRPWEVGQQGLCPADQEGGGEPRPRQSVEFCPPAQSPASLLHPSCCHTVPQTPGARPQFRDRHTANPRHDDRRLAVHLAFVLTPSRVLALPGTTSREAPRTRPRERVGCDWQTATALLPERASPTAALSREASPGRLALGGGAPAPRGSARPQLVSPRSSSSFSPPEVSRLPDRSRTLMSPHCFPAAP